MLLGDGVTESPDHNSHRGGIVLPVPATTQKANISSDIRQSWLTGFSVGILDQTYLVTPTRRDVELYQLASFSVAGFFLITYLLAPDYLSFTFLHMS